MPRVDELMEEYLRSERYRIYSTRLTFTDPQQMEEANYAFWRSLTPNQRLELHQIMLASLYSESMTSKENTSEVKELVFIEPSV